VRERIKVDIVLLGSGVVIAALGALLLLDSSGPLDVSPGWMAVLLTGAVGGILLLSGLLDGGPKGHD
jgi:hypothetical protein